MITLYILIYMYTSNLCYLITNLLYKDMLKKKPKMESVAPHYSKPRITVSTYPRSHNFIFLNKESVLFRKPSCLLVLRSTTSHVMRKGLQIFVEVLIG